MADEEQYPSASNHLRNGRTIEDQWRDDMTAMSYMNSKSFGAGIDVAGSSQPNRAKVNFAPVQVGQDQDIAEDATSQVVVMPTVEPMSPVSQAEFEATVPTVPTGPPPREPLPAVEPGLDSYGTGEMDDTTGSWTTEGPLPVTPALAPIQEPPLQIMPEVPEEPLEIQIPNAVLDVLPQPPPIDAASPVIQEPEPEAFQPEENARQAMPWFQAVDIKVPPAYDKDDLQGDMQHHGPEQISVASMEELARKHASYLEQMSDILYGMSDRIDEAMMRLGELESIADRRYRRSY